MLHNKLGPFLVLLLLGFIWGSSFILMKKGLMVFDSLQVASLRLFFAGLIAFPYFILYRKSIQRADWKYLAIAGFIGNGFPAFMFSYAIHTGLDSALVGGLNALTPVFTLLVGLFLFGTSATLKQLIGLGIGFAGTLILIFNQQQLHSVEFSLIPFIIVGIATFFYGININIIKAKFAHISPISAGLMPLAMVSLPATAMVFTTGASEGLTLNQPPVHYVSVIAVLILGVVGTAISLFIFNALVKKTDALFASAVNYLLPFVAFFWGVWDGEIITWLDASALLFILLGIYLIRNVKQSTAKNYSFAKTLKS